MIGPAVVAKPYANCAQLQKVYKFGIAKSQSAVKAAGAIQAPRINAKLYNENKKLDRDKDGVVCEVSKSAAASPSPTAPNVLSLTKWTYGPSVLDSSNLGFFPVDVEPVLMGAVLRVFVERFGVRGIVSFATNDGVTFAQDDGVRLTSGAFPSVVSLANGSYRMYFSEGTDIRSAVSTDGLAWMVESGVRVQGRESAVVQLKDGRWLMALRVDGTEAPPNNACNKSVSHIDFFVSDNGLTFTRVGRVVDSVKDAALNGRAFGNEFARFSDGNLYLMYEGCAPLYFAPVNESSLSLGKSVEVPALRGRAVVEQYGQDLEIGGAGGDHGFVVFKGQNRTYFGMRSKAGSREQIATAVLAAR